MLNEEDFSKDESLICLSQFDFSNLLYNSLFSDFTIRVPNPPEGKQSFIPTHRFILNSCSGYFRNYFEISPNEKEVLVCFPDWATDGIYLILEHMYSRKSIQLSVENISSIVCVAFSWSIDSLKSELFNFLETKIPNQLSLPILLKIINYIPTDCRAEQSLIELTGRNLSLYQKTQFETLPYNIFIQIAESASHLVPDEKNTFALCEVIDNYFQKNIVNLGSHEYNQLVKKFTMKANHNGIINLYKFGLLYGWNVRLVETKILHTWKNLNQEMLSQLPIQSLRKLIHENFLNIDSEDDLVDFIFLVYKNQSSSIELKLQNALISSSIQSNHKSFSVSNFKSNFASKSNFTQNCTSHSLFNLNSNHLDSSSLLLDDNSLSSNFKSASDLYSSSTNEYDDDKHISSPSNITNSNNLPNDNNNNIHLNNDNNNNTNNNNNNNSLNSDNNINTNNNNNINSNINNNNNRKTKNSNKINNITNSTSAITNPSLATNSTDDNQISSLWKEVRLCFLSKNSIIKMNASPLVPESIKSALRQNTYSTNLTPRLPRTKVKCLILGACDDSALRDVRNLLLQTSFTHSNVQSVRADNEFDVNMIFEFHSIFIFGFYKFWNREEVSKKLFEFHNEGGGVFVCYGANRSDGFGLGEPFLSCLPIENVTNPDLTNEFIITDKRKTRSEGCKYLRAICRARNDGSVENYWDDGVPFLIRKGRDKEGHGAIYILNATPVSSDVIGQQWSKDDKHIQNMISNVIIYVSNVLISKRSNNAK